MIHSALYTVWREERVAFVPRDTPRDVLTWCPVITLPGGTRRGTRYDPTSHPGQIAFLRAYAKPEWTDFVVVGPTQDGKTITVAMIPLLHQLIEVGDSAVYGLPNELTGLRQWVEKIEPALRLSGLDSYLPRYGVGSAGGSTRVTVMQFNGGGVLTWIGGGAKNQSAQSSVSAPVVVGDEIDDMREGVLDRIERRADAYGMKAKRIKTSTVKLDVGSKILGLLAQSTDGRLWHPCPVCGRYQELSWDRVEYDDADELTAFESAHIACAHCPHRWSDDERRMALRRAVLVMRGQTVDEHGDLVGAAPRILVWGLLWTALDSPFRNLGQLAVWHLRARVAAVRNDHGPMRQFCHDQLCRVYTGDQVEGDEAPAMITRAHLAARSGASTYDQAPPHHVEDGDSYHVAECPTSVAWLTTACDVQRGGQRAPGRLYFTLHGFDGEFRSYELAWGSLVCAPIGQEPSTGELHVGLDRLDALVRQLEAEMARPIVRRGVDVGDRQDEIRLWLVKHAPWWPLKGPNGRMRADTAESDAFDVADWIYRRRQDPKSGRPWWLYFPDVNLVRWQAQAAFLLPAGQAGAAHLPRGVEMSDSLVRHYCGTAMIPDGRGGMRWSDRAADRTKGHPEQQRRVDLLDCRTMAVALAYQYARTLNRPTIRKQYGVIAPLGA